LCAQIDAVRASGVRPEYALIDLASGKPFGQASYLNIDPAAGSIEVGGIVYAPAFQRGIAATEAMYLGFTPIWPGPNCALLSKAHARRRHHSGLS